MCWGLLTSIKFDDAMGGQLSFIMIDLPTNKKKKKLIKNTFYTQHLLNY